MENNFNVYTKDNNVLGIVNQISNFTHLNMDNVKVVNLNESPYFCLADVLRALDMTTGYRNILLAELDERDHTLKSLPYGQRTQCKDPYYYIDCPVQTGIKADGSPAIRISKTVFISEGSLYYIIFKSNKPKAVEFQAWVDAVLLPQARELGRERTDEVLKRELHEVREENEMCMRYVKTADALLEMYQVPITDQITLTNREAIEKRMKFKEKNSQEG